MYSVSRMSDLVCISAEKLRDDIDLSLFSSIVHNCIKDDKLSKLRAILKKFSRDQRQRIVHQKINGNPPLFTACMEGKVHFVNYLLEECAADVEMKGIYEVQEDHSRHEVTPLWCAAVANKLEVVKTLVYHGADVNSPSDTDSTPVRSACYMTNIAVIKFLVDNGANIHKPNVNGGTCLINSVQNESLCLFLINKGADSNAKDNSGNLALHYAIREGRTETVKLLLKHGSDYQVKNELGDNALQTAALRGYGDIVEVILSYTKQSLSDTVDAYELLGANYVDEKNDMVAALTVWKKAMKLRYSCKDSPVLKKVPKETNAAYNHLKEPETVEVMNNTYDPEEIHMQALLIRERILGPYHKDTTFGLMYRGAVYADSHRFQRCVDLWKYAYILRHQKCEPLNQECLFTVQALVKLFWEIQVEVESNASDEKVQVNDVLQVLGILTEQIKTAQSSLMKNDVEFTAKSDFQLLLQLCLHMIHLVSRIECKDKEKMSFMDIILKLVLLNPRGTEGETLLHLAVDPKISLTGEEFYSPFPSLAVIKILLLCGMDVNTTCEQGFTPLHNAVRFLNFHELHDEGILDTFLRRGAHVDIVSKDGTTALSALKDHGLPFSPLNHVSLRCLAARVIMQHGMSYEESIPSSLIPFVKLHGPQQ